MYNLQIRLGQFTNQTKEVKKYWKTLAGFSIHDNTKTPKT